MKKIYCFILVILFNSSAFAQYQQILADDFSGEKKYIDLSTLLLWGNNVLPKSTFIIKEVADQNNHIFKTIQLTPEAKNMGGYVEGTAFTSTSIDYEFNKVYRYSDTIKLEFDMYSELLSGNGESGRFGIAFMYDYPEGGPVFNDVFDKQKTHPFGRPAYNLRLLNGTSTLKQAYLFYGGGSDKMGEFEKNGSGVWLPGFISAPGGSSPGSQPDYPTGPVKIANVQTVNDRVWKHYTVVLMPEKIEAYWRNVTEDASKDQMIISMAIPKDYLPQPEILQKINQHHQTNITQLPVNYNWFSNINGLRFYFRSAQNSFLSNIKLQATNHFKFPVAVLPENENIFTNDDPKAHLNIALNNPHPDFETKVLIKLVKGNAEIINNEILKEVVFSPNNGLSKQIDFTINHDIINTKDTLVFEIEVPDQKSLAVKGNSNTATMIIENNTLTASKELVNINNLFFPNPAVNFLKYKGHLASKVEIFDLSGQKLITTVVNPSENISIETLPQGLYILNITIGNTTSQMKLIKN